MELEIKVHEVYVLVGIDGCLPLIQNPAECIDVMLCHPLSGQAGDRSFQCGSALGHLLEVGHGKRADPRAPSGCVNNQTLMDQPQYCFSQRSSANIELCHEFTLIDMRTGFEFHGDNESFQILICSINFEK